MNSIRSSARRRGLRMAAQVAAITGFVAAGAAYGGSSPARAAEPPAEGAAASDEGATGGVNRFASVTRVSANSDCGCSPCWGPPAPPAMRAELLDEALS